MRAGTLRKRITIEVATETKNTFQEPVPTWAEFAQRWARVSYGRGGEQQTDQQRYASILTSFRMRFIEGVNPKMRIVMDSRVFNIRSVNHVRERRHETWIDAEEQV